ncbi:MAG: sulfotransferase family 2 domain-containing protein [Sphingomonadaceae bacterium]
MGFFRSGNSFLFFAHVPKCGGTSVEHYLVERFGPLAFYDSRFLSIPERDRWSRTSPQHVDWATVTRLVPPEWFAHVFAVVRHPEARIISDYHWQQEVEQTIPADLPFAAFLEQQFAACRADPFLLDNHVRPMADLVPAHATVFHLEHGLDRIIPWLDAATGSTSGPRFIPHANERGAHGAKPARKVQPTDAERQAIADFYAEDFRRFGYVPGERAPRAAPVPADPAFLAAAAEARARADRPLQRLAGKVRRKLSL